MRIAILSAGPSLCTWPREVFAPYDLRIAVNSAAEFISCEWWSVADAVGIRELAPIGEPLIYTRGPIQAARSAVKVPPELEARLRRWDKHRCDPNVWPGTIWRTLSVCAALQLAAYLGAKTVDVYGHDMEGVPDWRGLVNTTGQHIPGRKLHNRNDGRWGRERKKWNQCVKVATEQGITVRRYKPDGVLETREAIA